MSGRKKVGHAGDCFCEAEGRPREVHQTGADLRDGQNYFFSVDAVSDSVLSLGAISVLSLISTCNPRFRKI